MENDHKISTSASRNFESNIHFHAQKRVSAVPQQWLMIQLISSSMAVLKPKCTHSNINKQVFTLSIELDHFHAGNLRLGSWIMIVNILVYVVNLMYITFPIFKYTAYLWEFNKKNICTFESLKVQHRENTVFDWSLFVFFHNFSRLFYSFICGAGLVIQIRSFVFVQRKIHEIHKSHEGLFCIERYIKFPRKQD